MKKLFVFDLDGTLVHGPKDAGRGIPPYLRDTVNELSKRHHVIVATGRRYRTAMVDVSSLNPISHIVVHNGSVVASLEGRTLNRVSMTWDDALFAHQEFRKREIPQLLVVDGFNEKIDFCFLRDELQISDVLQRVAKKSIGFYQEIDQFLDLQKKIKLPLLEIATVGRYEDLKPHQEYFSKVLPESLRCLVVQNIGYSEWAALEVLPKQVSKWSGIEWVSQQLGIDQVVTVGDDDNDIEMLKNASFSIVMGHARPHVKSVAKHEVEGPEALSKFLREKFLNEKS